MEYKFAEIEEKWKKIWEENAVYKVTEDPAKPKYYVLDMFPYPSGAGLHVGHPLGYVASDIYARYKRLKGFNVLHPMGYDAFGLPAEQYAIETGTHPAVTTANAIKRYREQMDKIGFSFDWSREVRTCEPDYYKWTQWIFLKLYNSWYNRETNKAEPIETLVEKFKSGEAAVTPLSVGEGQGVRLWNGLTEAEKHHELMNYRLAFQSYSEVNWCAALGTVLANDEIKDGKSERGGHPIERRKMRQWFLRITEYSDRLLDGLDKLDWSDAMKEMQRNWIGRSEGASVQFQIPNSKFQIEVFTTRPDTIFGATFMVIAAEHELVDSLTTPEQKVEVDKYIVYVKSRTDVERQQEKKVTGVFTGSYAVNPFTNENIPVYIAEYVLGGYGTGAIMAVPADDERDKKFAEKFGLKIIDIVDKSMYPGATIEDKVGKMINSGFINGMEVKDAIKAVIAEMEKRGIGKMKVNYKQRDAGYSRQRYWGEPFPIQYKVVGQPDPPFEGGETDDIPVPLSEDKLPLILPEVSSYKPSGDGRAPLANNAEWAKAGYETDTMPGYAASSWYFLRYMDPKNNNEFAAKDKINYWQNVDIYFGGAEHAVGHLLYSRFWNMFLYDLGLVPFEEPFKKLVNQGMIQGVSRFVYRLSFGYSWLRPGSNNDENPNYPLIFISKGVYERVTSGKKSNYDIESIANAVSLAGKIMQDKKLPGTLKFDANLASSIHVELDLLNDNILDTERFKKESRLGNENSLFVTEEDGNYVCGSEVEKMSKSKYNVVNPDDVIEKYGADCFRMFEMFLGPIEQSKPWDDKGISGVSNFLKKFWRLFYDDTFPAGSSVPAGSSGSAETLRQGADTQVPETENLRGTGWKVTDETPTDAEFKILHKTIKKIAEDIERLNFNTSVSAFMIATNELGALKCHKRAILEPLLVCLAPFAPFITEELWAALGNKGSIHLASYPKLEEKYLTESAFDYPVSINGKVRAQVKLSLDLTPQQVQDHVLAIDSVAKWTNGAEPKKFIFVKGKIINVVV